jgi:hypothetical protein
MTVTVNASTSAGVIVTSDTSGALALQTAGTTALTISSAQAITMAGRTTNPTTISVGNATPSTSGSGITFPATQSASSDANTLDDYEEGSWTPDVYNNGSSSTWSVKIGRYTKVGNLVTCWFNCDGGNTGTAGGALLLSNLPFSDIGDGNYQVLGTVITSNNPSLQIMIQGAGGTTAQIWANGAGQETGQKTFVSGMFTFRS